MLRIKSKILVIAIAMFFCKGLTAQTPIQEFRFNNSYANQAGGINFSSNAGTSFVADRKGSTNGALNINNTGSIATIPGLPYGSAARSISVWVKLNTFNSNAYNMLYGYGQGATGTANGASIASNTTIHLGYNSNHFTPDFNIVGVWNHYVFSYDGTTSKIYKNGQLIGSQTIVWNTIPNANLFKLGTGVAGELWFSGALDDIKIYDRAITLNEVRELFYDEGLVQEFNFDNSYTSQTGTATFGSNAGTSFVADRKGNANSAININNTGAIATITGLAYSNAARSVSVWVKLNTFNSNGYDMIYGYGQGSMSNSNGGVISQSLTYHLGYNNNHVIADANTLNTWNHYVFVYDGTVSKVYKNGSLIGSQAMAWNTLNNSDLFKLGTGVAGELWFNGAIDDLKIFKKSLRADEVSEIYGEPLATVHEWNFDNTYANKANTYSFTSNTGTSFTTNRFGETNKALAINNTGTFISGGVTGLPTGNSARTISFWFRNNTPQFQDLFVYGDAGANNCYGVMMDQFGSFLNYRQNFGSTYTPIVNTTVSSTTSIGSWYHVVLVYTGDSARIYRNGEINGEAASAIPLTTPTGALTVNIGRVLTASSTPFNGAIDDLRIYNRALTANEVARLHIQQTVLPVQISSFTAKLNNQTTHLNWQTSQEINTSHFEVEYSNNGNNFTKVTELAASGNSTTTKSYTATHEINKAAAIHYYRLKMIDKDGKFTYSNIVALKANSKGVDVTVYPTIVKNTATLSITTEQNQTGEIVVSNMFGQVVHRNKVALSAGTNTQQINVSNYAKGGYVINVIVANESKVVKLIKE